MAEAIEWILDHQHKAAEKETTEDAKKSKGKSRVEFEVLFLMRPEYREKVQVVAHVGPGDDGEAVLTLMLPGDD